MSFKKEFTEKIKDGVSDSYGRDVSRPNIEVWPDEDGFGQWVASHEDKVRTVICGTPEFKDAPFCGRGSH
jgi:hypothetical protein